jgi:hypothetical protein
MDYSVTFAEYLKMFTAGRLYVDAYDDAIETFRALKSWESLRHRQKQEIAKWQSQSANASVQLFP